MHKDNIFILFCCISNKDKKKDCYSNKSSDDFCKIYLSLEILMKLQISFY